MTPEPQDCDDKAPTSHGIDSHYCIRALGHRGWHRDDTGAQWRHTEAPSSHKHGVFGTDYVYATPGEVEQGRKDAEALARVRAWAYELWSSGGGWDADISLKLTLLLDGDSDDSDD
jgi:hypothetical protein